MDPRGVGNRLGLAGPGVGVRDRRSGPRRNPIDIGRGTEQAAGWIAGREIAVVGDPAARILPLNNPIEIVVTVGRRPAFRVDF